jgi:leucyl aminopeptidase
MTLDCFAAPDQPATPILALTRGDLDSMLKTLPAAQARFAGAAGFRAQPGSHVLLPGTTGDLDMVLAGIDSAEDPHALSALPYALPEGCYRMAGGIDAARAALSWGLGAYRFTRYRALPRGAARLAIDPEEVSGALGLVQAVYQVRDLVNTPTEDMGPAELAAEVRILAERHDATVREWVGEDLLKNGFPAIHAVGRASHRPPRLIELLWGDRSQPGLAIVGKGVCFDTGGLNLKGGEGMRNMKKDMGGAAHAIALARLVMESGLPVHLTLLIPAVENAVAGNAFRPGEVLQTRAGISVEVDNTDAEGRLILCDALTLAAEQPQALIIDFATLTGAARIALGPELVPLYANRDAVAAGLLDAASRVRDPLWRMPLWRPYLELLDSSVADIANSGSRMAGSVTAALFLEKFIPENQPWVHLDTFAWNPGDKSGRPKGGEAQGLRAVFEYLRARFAG